MTSSSHCPGLGDSALEFPRLYTLFLKMIAGTRNTVLRWQFAIHCGVGQRLDCKVKYPIYVQTDLSQRRRTCTTTLEHLWQALQQLAE
jgi:hypothetical protein